MSLILHNTNFKQLDGDGPEAIDLRRAKTIIGRGSQTYPVDAAVFARKNGADIISRRHAEISRSADGIYTITDLMAVNGTFVNSIRIQATKELKNGDIIQFGGLTSVMTGPDAFCVKYVFRGIGSSSQNAKVATSKKEELNKKKITKKGAKGNKKHNVEAIDLSSSDSRSKKRVRIEDTNDINVDNNDENQNMEDNLRKEIEDLRNEMLEMKKCALESRLAFAAAATATTFKSSASDTLKESSQSKQKNILASSGTANKTDINQTPGNRERGSREDLVQHYTTVRTPKEHCDRKEDSDKKEDSRGKESSIRTECSLSSRTSNSTVNCSRSSGSSSSGCAIDISSLRSTLTCAICSLVLLDAVIVPCSHGVSILKVKRLHYIIVFLFKCFEHYVSTEASKLYSQWYIR